MEYINIKKTTHLSVNSMNAIYNNFLFIKEKIMNAGIVVGELYDNSVTYNIALIDILEKFNNVERNIQIIHTAVVKLLGTNEKYYKNFTWNTKTENRKDEVWRWIDWQNNLKNATVLSEVLYDSNNEPIVDIDGNEIKTFILKEN